MALGTFGWKEGGISEHGSIVLLETLAAKEVSTFLESVGSSELLAADSAEFGGGLFFCFG